MSAVHKYNKEYKVDKYTSETGILPETSQASQHALSELGLPEHFYLAPGCYRTAAAPDPDMS